MKKNKNKTLSANELTTVLSAIFAIIILLSYCFNILFNARVDGESMMPTLTNNQRAFGSCLGTRDRGDIVVIDVGDKSDYLIIKRIIGLPGETISIKGTNIYINGELLEEEYLDESLNQGNPYYKDMEITLSDDEYFCMGDNRDNSSDSRYYGPFTSDQILAEMYIY